MNTYTFLVENAEAIQQIPEFAERLARVEAALFPDIPEPVHFVVVTDEPEFDQADHDELFLTDGFDQDDHDELFLTDGFDQDDHDELFADGGATNASFSVSDWGELFSAPIAADPTLEHPAI